MLLEFDVFPVVWNILFVSGPLGWSGFNFTQHLQHIISPHSLYILHCAVYLKGILLTNLVDICGVFDGRRPTQVEWHCGPGLVGENGAPAVEAAAILPCPYCLIVASHVPNGFGVGSVLNILPLDIRVCVGFDGSMLQ